jgi:hypothetical protein
MHVVLKRKRDWSRKVLQRAESPKNDTWQLNISLVSASCPHVAFERRRRRSDSRTKALIFRVFHALLPLPHALLPRPLMISTRNF